MVIDDKYWSPNVDPRSKEIYIELIRAADKYYRNPHCFYHNLGHANAVLETVVTTEWMGLPVLLPPYLWLAAKWHDAAYVPGSKYNEELSSFLFRKEALALGLPTELIDQVTGLIEKTTVNHHLAEHNVGTVWGILLDADLRSLAVGTYSMFVNNQLDIANEFRSSEDAPLLDYELYVRLVAETESVASGNLSRPLEYDDIQAVKKIAAFLKQFTDKKKIYRNMGNSPIVAEWEVTARANIARFCEDVRTLSLL